MPHAAPKADAVVPATRNSEMWVLLRMSPRVAVLATSSSRNRLISEMAQLYGIDRDQGLDPDFRLAVRLFNHLI